MEPILRGASLAAHESDVWCVVTPVTMPPLAIAPGAFHDGWDQPTHVA